jgi:hypothetical protein
VTGAGGTSGLRRPTNGGCRGKRKGKTAAAGEEVPFCRTLAKHGRMQFIAPAPAMILCPTQADAQPGRTRVPRHKHHGGLILPEGFWVGMDEVNAGDLGDNGDGPGTDQRDRRTGTSDRKQGILLAFPFGNHPRPQRLLRPQRPQRQLPRGGLPSRDSVGGRSGHYGGCAQPAEAC